MKFNRRSFLTILLLIVVAIVVYLLAKPSKSSPEINQPQTTATTPSISTKHPSAWTEQPIYDDSEKSQGVVIKLQRSDPTAFLLVRSLETSGDDQLDLKSISDGIVASLKEQSSDFSLISTSTSKIKGFDTVEINYSQPEADNKTENKLIVVPLSNKTYYLNYKVKDASLKGLDSEMESITEDILARIDKNGNIGS